MKNKQGLLLAKKLLSVQFIVTFIVAIILGLFTNLLIMRSVLLGGFVVIVPTFLFSLIFFKNSGALNARKIARNFYLAELIKINLSVILFALVFIFCKIMPLVFFITFIIVQMITWFMPLLVKR